MTATLRSEARDWIGRAACRNYPPEWWYPEGSGPNNAKRALKVCGECPVIGDCGTDARERGELYGIWGGRARIGTALGSQFVPKKYEQIDEPPLHMRACVCIRCKRYWATTAAPGCLTTVLCPDCVGRSPKAVGL